MYKSNYKSDTVRTKVITEDLHWKLVYAFLVAQFIFVPAVLYWFTKVFE